MQAIFGTRSENLKTDMEEYMSATPQAAVRIPAVAAMAVADVPKVVITDGHRSRAAAITAALGGIDNITESEAVALTRVRVVLRDASRLNESALTAAGVVSALSIFYTIMGVSLFVPIVAGLFSQRAATADALAAIVAGIAIVGGLKLWPSALSIAGVTPAMAGLAGSITAFFVVQLIRRVLGGPDGPTRTFLPSLSE
jgi:phosphotransferase system IIB component